MIPKLKVRQLPDDAARSATNTKLTSGELVPYRKPKSASVPSKPKPLLAIYSAPYGTNLAWLTWPFDVDVVRMPLFSEVEPRFAWTGDGEPRWATYGMATSGGGNDYPKTFFALGIPKPTSAPTVTPTGGSGSNVTRFYCYTFFSQHGEESAPSPVSDDTTGKVDGSWAIAGMAAFPTSSGTGTASYAAGETTFTNGASAPTWLRVGDQVVIDSTTLTVTATPSADSFKVPGDFSAETTWARVAPWNTTGMKRRLYRTAGTAAGFQLVDDDVGTTYTDTLSDADIPGDDLISQNYDPPPTGLKGLCVTSFGSLVGFFGNQLWMTEPYQGFAWKYSFSTDFPIVAIANAGNDIGVGTQAYPYCGIGSDPSNFILQKIESPYPCLSKRSMYADGSGAGYATKHGMAYIIAGQARIITEPWFTVDEWKPLQPETMFCEYALDRVFIGYNDGSKRMLVLDTAAQTLIGIDMLAYDIYQDDSSGVVYVSTADGIFEMDPVDGAPLSMELWSKQYTLPKPINFGAAVVEFDAAIDNDVAAAQQAAHDAAVTANAALISTGDVGGYFGDSFFGDLSFAGDYLVDVPDVPAQNLVTFTLYDEEKVVYSRVVASSKPFRLPAGRKMQFPSIKVNGQCAIRRTMIAETIKELESV